MATEKGPIKVPCENEDSAEKENATGEDTLGARADVYRNQGNEAFKKGHFLNAIHFYTEGIKVNCKDKEPKAKLYSNRATAHFKLGNHQDSLSDAKAATELQPTYLKAIVRGASACVELKRFEEAITWCDKGLAIEQNNGILMSLRLHSVREVDLKVTKEVGDKYGEGMAYSNLGNACYSQGNFQKAIEYHNLDLKIAKEVGDKHGEGEAYGNLGNAYQSLGDFKKAIEYCTLHLEIAKEVGDRHGEGCAYCNLGSAYQFLGDFKKAIEYLNLCLPIVKEVGDKVGEGKVYGNLGNTYHRQGNFEKAVEYHKLKLEMAKEVRDRHGEGVAYGSLGSAHRDMGDFKKAIVYQNLSLKIAKEVGDKVGEGNSYGNIGNAYQSLGDFKKAIEYLNLCLKIAKEVGDKVGKGKAYGNLGNAYQSLGDFRKAIEYINLHLDIAKEVGDKHGEGQANGNLGNVYQSLGDFRKAIEYHNLHLEITKVVGDRHGEGKANGNLGNAYQSLGELEKAIEYFNLALEIAKEVGDKGAEGNSYCNFSNAYQSLGDFKQAIEYCNLHLKIAKEIRDRHGEGMAYGNLGSAHQSLGDFRKAIEYHNLHLEITKVVGDRLGEGQANGNLGNDYKSLGDFKKAIKYLNLHLEIAKEVGDKVGEGQAYGNLGNVYFFLGDVTKAKESYNLLLKIAQKVEDKSLEAKALYLLARVFNSLGRLPEAVEHLQASITLLNALRLLLKSKDEWKVNFRNQYQNAYAGLWKVLANQGKIDEALITAEKGRAQALTDLMESSFCGGASQPKGDDEDLVVLKNIPSNTVFQAVDEDDVYLWVVSKGKQVQLRQIQLKDSVLENSGVSQSFESFVLGVYTQLGVRSKVSCENRSLDDLRESREKRVEKTEEYTPHPSVQPPVKQEKCLSTLYDLIIKPVADLVEGAELLIVPDGLLWRVPYAALKDGNSKYLCESFRIRLAPSLTSLRLIADCPEDYHKSSGALLVGDPWVAEVTNGRGEKLLEQLPCAEEEVEMIGRILKSTPITGRQATKREVLERLSSVSLVHFAAHGCLDTGEIALTPDPHRLSTVPTREDYILTIGEVLNAQIRARLVVLSCCYSGRGEIKAEGVVGIARAFMGAGAQSVLVSLWAIDDEATLEFMKCFYRPLAEGNRASESLNLAMKSLRESDNFSDVKHWAPFLLIGDDITLDFSAKKGENS